MRKCLVTLIFLFLSFTCVNVQAAADPVKPLDLTKHHFTVGLSFSNYPADSFWLVAGGISDYWLWRVSGSLFFIDPSHEAAVPSYTLFCGALHLGGRKPLSSKIGFEYGVVGSYITREDDVPNSTEGYTVGPFVGLDCIIGQHFLIAATIQPYTYRQNIDRSVDNVIFGQGMLSVSYMI